MVASASTAVEGGHRFAIQTRFCDSDCLGHINNAVYLSYFEACRIDWLKTFPSEASAGPDQSLPIILARSEIDYLQQGYLQDQLSVMAWIEHIGTTSFTQAYEVRAESRGVIARGKAVLVWFDFDKQAKTEIPEAARRHLEGYLHNNGRTGL